MTNRELMNKALELAREAAQDEEVPVGAVVSLNGEIIACGRNSMRSKANPLRHAEIEAINGALAILGEGRLGDCTLHVTLEPCPMCAGAIINARLKKVVFGAYDYKSGSMSSVIDLTTLGYNHTPQVQAGFCEDECAHVLSEFFAKLRAEKRAKRDDGE